MKKIYFYNKETLRYEEITHKKLRKENVMQLLGINITIYAILALAIVGLSVLLFVECGSASRYAAQCDERNMEIVYVRDSVVSEKTLESAIAEYGVTANTEEISEDALRRLLDECGAWYPDVIVAQFKIESGSGTSNVAQNAHNLFGMKKVSGKRKSYTTQEKHSDYYGYGVYKNWQMSVIDRILFERFYFSHKRPSEREYMDMLNGYAEDPNYYTKIENMIK